MIKKNIIANFIGRMWGLLSLVIFIPFYIDMLGEKQYGIVGFYIIMVSFLAFFDMGFSASINREMAKSKTREEKSNILFTYQILFSIIAIIILLLLIANSYNITHHWLNLNGLTFDYHLIITLIAFSLALQFPATLYVNSLMGLEKQVEANIIQISWGALRGVSTICVLYFYESSLSSFFIAQLISNLIYVLVLYIRTWAHLNINTASFKFSVLYETWKYALTMAIIGVLSLYVIQLDRFYVSKFYDIEYIGFYSIAITYASIPTILAFTVSKALFPRMVRQFSADKDSEFVNEYLKINQYFYLAIFPVSILLISLSSQLIFYWTGSQEVVDKIGLVAVILVASQSINALTVLPYNLALSNAYLKVNFVFILISIFVLSILIFLLGQKSIVWVALCVLLTQLSIFIPYIYSIHYKLASKIKWKWFLNLLLPMFVSMFFVIINQWVYDVYSISVIQYFIIVIISSVLTFFILIIFQKNTRLLMFDIFRTGMK
jgi:O-antigen/teichoic acid export membrane protein